MWDNVLSIIATAISAGTLIFTIFQTNRAYRNANKPILLLSSIMLEIDKVKVYGGKNISWTGKQKFPDNYLGIIERTSKSNSYEDFNDVHYLLINSCSSDTSSDDIGLILNVLNFSIENNGVQVSELSIKRGYSITNDKEPLAGMTINVKIPVKNDVISIPIAYVYPYYAMSSMNLGNIAKLTESDDKSSIVLYNRNDSVFFFTRTSRRDYWIY